MSPKCSINSSTLLVSAVAILLQPTVINYQDHCSGPLTVLLISISPLWIHSFYCSQNEWSFTNINSFFKYFIHFLKNVKCLPVFVWLKDYAAFFLFGNLSCPTLHLTLNSVLYPIFGSWNVSFLLPFFSFYIWLIPTDHLYLYLKVTSSKKSFLTPT